MTLTDSDNLIIKEVDQFLEKLVKQLKSKLPPIKSKPGEKLLRLTILWRETLLHRIVDLASVSKDMFQKGRLVPGCTLTRALFESVAMQYYLLSKILNSIDNENIDEIHEKVIRGFWGSRDGKTKYNALQVLTAIDHLDKVYKGIRSEYDHLCEYAHPNMKGGFGSYTKIDIPSMSVEFGTNPQDISIEVFGLGALHIILMVSIDLHDQLIKVEPNLTKIVYKLAPGIYKD